MPRRVVKVEVLPREATGKLTAAALRRLAMAMLGEAKTPPSPTVAEGAVAEADFHIAPGHPAFAGHFPGRPLLPGAALLSLVMQALDGQPALRERLGRTPRVDSAKFLRPVEPDTRLHVALRAQGAGIAFEVRAGPDAVARGQLSAGPA